MQRRVLWNLHPGPKTSMPGPKDTGRAVLLIRSGGSPLDRHRRSTSRVHRLVRLRGGRDPTVKDEVVAHHFVDCRLDRHPAVRRVALHPRELGVVEHGLESARAASKAPQWVLGPPTARTEPRVQPDAACSRASRLVVSPRTGPSRPRRETGWAIGRAPHRRDLALEVVGPCLPRLV